MKGWMVEQMWEFEDTQTPVRSVVMCEEESDALSGAGDAVEKAVVAMAGCLIGKPVADPVVISRIEI
jgi:hypothetical protein